MMNTLNYENCSNCEIICVVISQQKFSVIDLAMAPAVHCPVHLSSLCGQIKGWKYSPGPLLVQRVSRFLLF